MECHWNEKSLKVRVFFSFPESKCKTQVILNHRVTADAITDIISCSFFCLFVRSVVNIDGFISSKFYIFRWKSNFSRNFSVDFLLRAIHLWHFKGSELMRLQSICSKWFDSRLDTSEHLHFWRRWANRMEYTIKSSQFMNDNKLLLNEEVHRIQKVDLN